MNFAAQEVRDLTVYRSSKQEILLNAIQSCISVLYDAAGSAEDSNEVENYMCAVKPLTEALIACVRMQDGV